MLPLVLVAPLGHEVHGPLEVAGVEVLLGDPVAELHVGVFGAQMRRHPVHR